LTFQKQGLAQKRPFDSEDGALGQQQYLTRLRELQSASETSLVNFPKSMPLSSECARNNYLIMKYSLPLPNHLLDS
jgi:chromodomain-helicase-DNA-binding protein 9